MSNKYDIQPPKLPGRILEWYCGPLAVEDLKGDLDELFYTNLDSMSLRRARIKYWAQMVNLLFSYAAKRRRQDYSGTYPSGSLRSKIDLLQSYSKVASRTLIKNKFFTTVNVLGLAIGMSVGLLALAAFMDVLEADKFNLKGDNIYRIISKVDDSNRKRTYANTSLPLSTVLENEIPGVDKVVRFNSSFNPQVQSNKSLIPLEGYYTDQSFFDVFSFNLVKGDKNTALLEPFSLVLTQSAVDKLFYNQNPIGQMITMQGLGDFMVTGVIEDYPRSHLMFEALTSMETMLRLEESGTIDQASNSWGPITNNYSYFLINPNTDIQDIQPILDQVSRREFAKSERVKVEYGMQNLFDIPKTDYYNEIGMIWGYLALTIFFALAFLILIPACFNYANISISRALKRSKEIGLRKVVGGHKRQIFFQFLIETIIVSVIALGGAILIFSTVRSEFLSMIVHGSRTFDLEITWVSGIAFVGFALFTGFISGFFPGMFFARMNPIETFRGVSSRGRLGKLNVRKTLVVLQFTISLVFILGVSIVVKQYKYALNYDMGFDKENILDVKLQGMDPEIFKNEFSRIPEVNTISMASSFPGGWMGYDTYVNRPDVSDSINVYQMFVDQTYIENLGLELVAGRNFPVEAPNEEEFIIVNQQFLVDFGISSTTEALDQVFQVDGKDLRVLGVVKDFNYLSLREKIESFFFRYDPAQFQLANLKLQSTDILATISKLENTWNLIDSGKKFEARFLDDEMEEALVSFVSMVKIFGFLGLLAITISCLGLLAMVVFTTENRTKEIGVRKVMGANAARIAYALSGGFVKLLAISILVAVPIAYFMFDKVFLRIHHYRANIGITEILISVFFMLFIGLLTIGSQTIKAAKANPVDSLKYE